MIRPFSVSDLLYIIAAARWTLLLFGIAVVGGSVLGAALAAMQLSSVGLLRWFAWSYARVIQGTPLLIQLFLVFFLPSVIDMRPDSTITAAITLSINAAAFLGDIWRGSIQAIPTGQWEAGRALGLSPFQRLRLVVAPQAMRIGIPPTVGFLVQMIKATSLASIIGFVDVTRAGQLLTNATAAPGRIYLAVTCIYVVLCLPVSVAGRLLEARLRRHP